MNRGFFTSTHCGIVCVPWSWARAGPALCLRVTVDASRSRCRHRGQGRRGSGVGVHDHRKHVHGVHDQRMVCKRPEASGHPLD
eukprot:CAMPEP_0181210656 /NCGR_PEP_ID=MMETSP1096-20121128/23355_1 /TAXON_ID=156174 ORGANISM="Chrysochromulina ericina, Strain CCMP281" /NCGR_SAMPLE_ID=MMETSP1096 /ASSEMBLY_ACC=CAM_ASM_000453 /LENGTH=82 /DNA_ID=CAMNT_0023301977 /DNA_START=145 /DNA_END=393 /DNA_ORIENTATION=+